ncbi:PREDICTED: permeability factor 2-like [Miniopterus natalensis]|uniref:permeability factor 2-like n=1 Tax=Miniopterus natalensis TaxID=291302 RepID=UPI0007A71E08|nr:PREDICTED: permeability factor 2-like [Miniopterus natalensis]
MVLQLPPLQTFKRHAIGHPQAEPPPGSSIFRLLCLRSTRKASGAPVASELRCQCLRTSQGIHPKNIQSVQVTSPGPHCAQTQVIATLKNGQKACLNPAAPMVKRILEKMLNK